MATNFFKMKPCSSCCNFICTLGEDKFNCQDAIDSELWEIKSGSWSLIDQTPFYCGQSIWQWNGVSWIPVSNTCSDECSATPPTQPGTILNQWVWVDCQPTTNTDKVLWTWDGTDWISSTDNCRYPTAEGYTACAASLTKPGWDGTTIGETVWRDCRQFQKLSGSGGYAIWLGGAKTEWQYISVSATASNAGDTVQIIFDYLDEDNYKFAEFVAADTTGYGSISLYERTSGTNTLITTNTRSVWRKAVAGTLKLCFTPNPNNSTEQLITARDLGTYISTYGTITNSIVGLGTSGTVIFENWTVARHHETTGNASTCAGCQLGGTGCFPNVSSHTLTGGSTMTVVYDPPFGDDWQELQTFYVTDNHAYLVTGAIDAEFEFTLMEPYGRSTAIYLSGYYRNATPTTTTGGGGTTTPTESGNMLLGGEAVWSHSHTATCSVQVYNYVTGAWEIPAWVGNPSNQYARQEYHDNEIQTVGEEGGDINPNLKQNWYFGIHNQHFDNSNHCKIRFSSTAGKLVIYRLYAGGEYSHPCTTATITGSIKPSLCGCRYCSENNGPKNLGLSQSAIDCRWTGTVCYWGSNAQKVACYYDLIQVYRKGQYLVFEGVETSCQIDITGLDWDSGSFSFPFSPIDGKCDWVNPLLTIEKNNGSCTVTDCATKPLCDSCSGTPYGDQIEVSLSGFAGPDDIAVGGQPLGENCIDPNGTFLLTSFGCSYHYYFYGADTTFRKIVCEIVEGVLYVSVQTQALFVRNSYNWSLSLPYPCNIELFDLDNYDCLFKPTTETFVLAYNGYTTTNEALTPCEVVGSPNATVKFLV